ncbi:hypothetical protein CC1G_12564 [Coprinopsis cinerea okayama7|uniref:Uncharacterized protein n=1 Tax=Coprinopsis cinerea (strain Okayama-7 / 130 / ATCC MYA-4618 / FGSC 9003) TaxID=240176 RepID=A8NU60_COPC7|nr:hypothetical protein CC1G_12564 [Coprinopsis cinerea okayama7\|eukprot:XP_001836383.2 hypothetical protein CC1G_12564 [Coprinopsis cinerea okayama7\
MQLDPFHLIQPITQWASPQNPIPHTPLDTPNSANSSPISSLPPEILAEIFLLALPADQFPSPSPSAAPLNILNVCSLWRQVAKATPALWSALHLSYQSADDDVAPTELWLSHSGNMPLSLSLSIDFDEKPHQAIIDVFTKRSARWKNVRLEFRHLQCPPMDISTFNVKPITGLLATAPHLKELTWVDDLADAETLHSLPLPRLSRLSLSMDYGSLDYLKLLNLCSNLEHIRITRPFPEIQPPQPPLVLTKLTSLNIAHDLTGLLDHLILPSLKHVRVHMDSGVPEHLNGRYSRAILALPSAAANGTLGMLSWDPTSLLNLVERSSCAIETLWVHAPMKESDLTKCLEASSRTLKSLTLSGGLVLGDTIIRSLTPRRVLASVHSTSSLEGDPDKWGCLCPSLSELVLDTPLPSTSSLVEMVQGRLGVTLPLANWNSASLIPSVTIAAATPQLHIASLGRLKVHYPSGHRDIDCLRELSSVANSENAGSFDLSIVESRTGNVRGSSAGRTRSFMYRRKACASR